MMRTRKTNLAEMAPAAMVAAIAILLAGCESSDDSSGAYWSTKSNQTPAQSSATTTEEESATSAADDGLGEEDQVPFGSFSWNFGGFSGGRAIKTTASITGLSINASGMTYRWKTGGCETLGASSRTDFTHTVACLFVQRSDGRWVGGKFDGISTSRTSRSFVNIFEGYNGWSLSGVPNPCPCAFVIVSTDGKKRTNVISGTWKR
ncbi:MAG: hypothetical protein ILM98_07580 [Kiritimatiellae bacterium]|nr:hypothetical protein [Kiritimatiellia bacterium]